MKIEKEGYESNNSGKESQNILNSQVTERKDKNI